MFDNYRDSLIFSLIVRIGKSFKVIQEDDLSLNMKKCTINV